MPFLHDDRDRRTRETHNVKGKMRLTLFIRRHVNKTVEDLIAWREIE
jgi:hypothetical protein